MPLTIVLLLMNAWDVTLPVLYGLYQKNLDPAVFTFPVKVHLKNKYEQK